MSNELVGSLPTCSQSYFLPWLLHLHHRLACNQALKQMLTSSGSIYFPLLLLNLLHIEQNVVVDTRNELHFLQKLNCSNLHIHTIVNLSSQGLQVVVCPQSWCSTSKNHERRKSCTCLYSTALPKQDFGQLLIPVIHVGKSSSKHSYTMLDGLDHALSHPIALRPLGCSALVLNSIIPTHHIEFCSPFPPIVSQHEFGNSIPTNYLILQKPGCRLCSMVSNRLCFASLRIVVDGHQNILVARLSLRQWPCNVQCNSME